MFLANTKYTKQSLFPTCALTSKVSCEPHFSFRTFPIMLELFLSILICKDDKRIITFLKIWYFCLFCFWEHFLVHLSFLKFQLHSCSSTVPINTISKLIFTFSFKLHYGARSLGVSDLRSNTQGFRIESGRPLCAEMNSLQ